MKNGIVKLVDINDYINAGQSCVKSIVESLKNRDGKEVKKITLDDCFSCAGCITSSESLLVNDSSLENHYRIIKDHYNSDNNIKLSLISYQSLESLLILYKKLKNNNQKELDYYKDISNIIADIINVDYIIQLNDFILYTLNLCFKEFLELKKNNKKYGLICSECPGWICYAEKKIGKISFEYMSKIKSPQEISGIIIRELFKNYLKNKIDHDKDIYICTIMPCYDKKIEAIKHKKGINTVISTIELEDSFKNYLSNKNISLKNKIIDIYTLKNNLKLAKNIKEAKEQINIDLSNNKINYTDINISLYNFPFSYNFSSNYYIEYITFMILKQNPQFYIERRNGKNFDSKEIIIYKNEEKKEIIYAFLISYGLRNIQNIVKMINTKKIKYDYIELMSCPGGCINGAAQIKTDKTRDDIFNDINNGFDDLTLKKDFIYESINNISQTVKELKIDDNEFIQTFKEVNFSMSDFEW